MNFPSDDIWPPSPPTTRSTPTDADRKTILGGLPAAGTTAWDSIPRTGRDPLGVSAPIQVATESFFDEPADADPFSLRSLRARLDKFVRKSPPLTVSISLHLIGVLMLAIWMIRGEPRQAPALEVAFASSEPAEEPGVTVEKEPEKPPEPEPVDMNLPPVSDPVAAPPSPAIDTPGPAQAGDARVAAPVIGTLLQGRDVGRREALVRAFGGTEETEEAVTLALDWLARQQRADGLWSLVGTYSEPGSQENQLAATAMALIAFQGAGHLPSAGKHRAVVARGWKRLLQRQNADGRFDFDQVPMHHTMYSHAQATIAVCELYGMTRDAAYEVPARRAIAYCLTTQGPNGGWRYQPGQDGDLSVTGWFMMALKSGQMAGIDVPQKAFTGIGQLLDAVAADGGSRYGYMRNASSGAIELVSPAMSAEGLLCRQYLGWTTREPRLMAGLEQLVARPLDVAGERDLYAWYYISQVAHHAGGTAWDRWNAAMRAALPKAQLKSGPNRGSWDPGGDRWGPVGGRLYATCFCTFMLEVYYRHLPLYAEIPPTDAAPTTPR
ncbi:MAG: prenyltransferase/squalene oxidase repeat-containing protein [Planctomycetia bacterium]